MTNNNKTLIKIDRSVTFDNPAYTQIEDKYNIYLVGNAALVVGCEMLAGPQRSGRGSWARASRWLRSSGIWLIQAAKITVRRCANCWSLFRKSGSARPEKCLTINIAMVQKCLLLNILTEISILQSVILLWVLCAPVFDHCNNVWYYYINEAGNAELFNNKHTFQTGD